MIDALLWSVRDAILQAGYGYSDSTCAIMPDGMPKASCGDWWVSIHQGASTASGDSRLDEMFAFSLTLTARIRGVPEDKIGEKLLAVKLADKLGFNRRAEQLRALFGNSAWGVLQAANDYIVTMSPEAEVVYGFCEPPLYRGMEVPVLVGGDWFSAEPDAPDVGLKSELRWTGCRRFQPIATYV